MLRFFYLFILLFTPFICYSQYIEGTIKDNNNSILVGTSIMNVDSKYGTISNNEGYFKLDASIGNVIQISHIGYKVLNYIVTNDTNKQFILEKSVYKIKNVKIKSKSLASQSILYNKEFEAKKEIPRTPIIDYKQYLSPLSLIKNPITFLYYSFNKKEQRRLQYKDLLYKKEDANRIYTIDLISDLTKVENQDELYSIKAFCHFSEDQILNNSYYVLCENILACYNEYKTHNFNKK